MEDTLCDEYVLKRVRSFGWVVIQHLVTATVNFVSMVFIIHILQYIEYFTEKNIADLLYYIFTYRIFARIRRTPKKRKKRETMFCETMEEDKYDIQFQ